MSKPTSYLLADRLLDGTLDERLLRYKRANVPWSAVSRLLAEEIEVEISAETLRRWGQAVDEEPTPSDSTAGAA